MHKLRRSLKGIHGSSGELQNPRDPRGRAHHVDASLGIGSGLRCGSQKQSIAAFEKVVEGFGAHVTQLSDLPHADISWRRFLK